MSLTINPAQMTNAAGSFSITTEGYVAGFVLDDPALRNEIAAGIFSPSASATSVLLGGYGITLTLPTAGTEADAVGSILTIATSQANLDGFTVYNQSAAMYQTPQSTAPLVGPGGSINFVRFGTGLRVVVPCSQAVAAALAGQPEDTALYWDYTNQVLLNTAGGTAIAAKLLGVVSNGTAQVPTYNSGTQQSSWNRAGYCAVIKI